MSGFIDRENQIFEILQQFRDRDLDFVVVGGYAVSAYKHRFSVDVDLVIQDTVLDEFTEVLEENGFEEVVDRELDSYCGRYLAFEKNEELPVTIDLLVNGLQCRQTTAAWSYTYFKQHSTTAEIEGSELTVEARIPEKELLVAVKLHSGRLTDARDAVALAPDLDLDELETHLDRGDHEKLEQFLNRVASIIAGDDFENAFKGVFQQRTLPEENIDKLQQFIQDRLH